MGDVTQFPGRRRPPPPPRQSRIHHLGVQMGGLKTPRTMLTAHREEMREDGPDWVVPWAYIAVKDRAIVAYGKGILPPYDGRAANDTGDSTCLA